jgi:type II secretory pathway pseudopilin PulG
MRGGRRHRHGGLLLEVVIALALLVMVGLFALGGARDGLDAAERAARRAAAVDLAASRLAEIEAGIITLDAVGDLQDVALDDEAEGFEDDPPRWPFAIEVETSPSAFEGLVRVEVVVRLDDPDAVGSDESIELARLVTLVDDGAEPAGEESMP